MAAEYLTFEEVLKLLQVHEAELNSLVVQGKLRAIRVENTLKFRRSEVENVRKQRETEPTLVIDPGGTHDTTEGPAAAVGGEAGDLFGQDIDYLDTADTIVGGSDLAGLETGETDFVLEPAARPEPGTKVPTIELTTPDIATEDTDIPILDLGEPARGGVGSVTEVPTMVLGLDEYDDTQVATEDVATEEVALEPGDLGDLEPTTDLEDRGAGLADEEKQAGAAVGRITASSSLGTGEPLAVREQPSTLYTVMSAFAAFFLLVPGALFFYCMMSSEVPKWDFLRSIVRFFWEQFSLTPPTSLY